MMQQVKGIDWDDLEIAIPAFLTIVLMPFTYSITVGIGAGFLAYVLIKVVRGKAAQVHPLLWVIAGAVRRLLRDPPDHRLAELTPPGRRGSAADHRQSGVTPVPPAAPLRRLDHAGTRVTKRSPRREWLAWVMSYANDMPTVEKVARTDAGLASELRLSVMRLRRRLANERHPDNELSLGRWPCSGRCTATAT